VKIAIVPSTPLLLPMYAGRVDPVPELRAAVDAAVAWLVADTPAVALVHAPPAAEDYARGVGSPLGRRIGRHLLGQHPVAAGGGALLAVADGSARRTEKAPGHLDERAKVFDSVIDLALREGDGNVLAGLDPELGQELWCRSVPVWHELAPLVDGAEVTVDWADDPFGVQYWVARCVSS
jgi:rRNA-processing protein FCF1